MANQNFDGASYEPKEKIISTLKKREKKKNAKLNPSNKPRYISKAEREKLAAQELVAELQSAPEGDDQDI
ncbi:DUF2986 domain-containing protein [Enterovibrio nigricans]|uniref:DUF2986 domain-containing protein n=1 Tax=Enterovibrio nigricans TaxID=504469 RepID=UPI001FCCF03E|nr:DUF2986 domain-containing protein [Enterovibrio nigricans]